MLGGSAWSWWLGTFFQIYIVLNYILETVLLRLFASDLLRLSAGDFFFMSVRIPIMLMFFVYFFTDEVLAYFGRSQERKLTAFVTIVLAAILMEAVELGLICLVRPA